MLIFMPDTPDFLKPALMALHIDDDGRTCEDIPEEACQEEGHNALLHVTSLGLSKSADGLVDPKLVLSWLMTTLGAPAFLIGFLVPVREAGALLPQLFTAGYLRALPQRKWVWSAGAVGQGLSALVIALAALFLQGALAGYVVLAALSVLAISRSISSVSYKDVLGKTIGKSRRGRVTGLAGSLSASVVIAYALILSTGLVPRLPLVVTGLVVSGCLWLFGAFIFSGLREVPGETHGGRNALKAALENLRYLKTDAQLRRFILTRGLLTATALAPPFMITAASPGEGSVYGQLGFLILASAGASLLSSFVWGWLSDHSSRKVLILSALMGCVALVATLILMMMGLLDHVLVLPVVLFVLMIGYQGVRLGRSTHLVDMTGEETRAAYTALSNTIIGVLLLAGGVFGVIAAVFGVFWVLVVLAIMCGLAILSGLGLEEVQC